MSKRDLKKYLTGLDAEALSEQLIELYEKFPAVKTYYDFVFHPNEEKRIGEAMQKIKNEYFPEKRKRARLRLSVAQNYFKHFETLGLDARLRAELMAFNIQTALQYTAKRRVYSDAFYKSITQSFIKWVTFLDRNAMLAEFLPQVQSLSDVCANQGWVQAGQWQSLAEEASDLINSKRTESGDIQ